MPSAPLISIVDDDDFLRNSLDNLLRSVGMRTHGFASADEFLNSNELHDTDCLLLDVRMPGMSGLDLQRQLRAVNSRIQIVFITSHADDDARVVGVESMSNIEYYSTDMRWGSRSGSVTFHDRLQRGRERSQPVRWLFCTSLAKKKRCLKQ